MLIDAGKASPGKILDFPDSRLAGRIFFGSISTKVTFVMTSYVPSYQIRNRMYIVYERRIYHMHAS